MSQAKIEEALQLIASAEKSLKTSFFKRTPDRDHAIELYSKAAILLKSSKSFEKSANVYEKIANLHCELGSLFHGAKNFESAALMYKELNQYEKMKGLITKAGDYFITAGTPDSASYLYQRAAKSLEEPSPPSSAEFYELSAKACEIEDKFHEAADCCNSAARVWIRIGQFDNTERCLRLYLDYICKANPDSVGATIGGLADASALPKLCAKVFLVLVLIKLHQEDEVAAAKVYSEAISNYRIGETDDNFVLKRLLSAYEDGDPAELTNVLKSSSMRNLDLDYARFARQLKLPPNMEAQTRARDSSPNPHSVIPTVNADELPHGVDEATLDAGSHSHVKETDSAEEDIC